MRLPNARWRSVGVSAVVVAAVAGITLGVTTLLGVTFQGSGSQSAEGAHPDADTTAQRNPLAICVQAVGADMGLDASPQAAAKEATAKSRIEAALPQIATHPAWERAGMSAFQSVIDIGCPSLPPEPDVPADALHPIQFIGGHVVEEPSPHRVFVFILPAAQLEDLIPTSSLRGKPTMRRAPQEMTCSGHNICAEVTTGVYLTEQEFNDTAFLSRVLEIGLWLGERP